MVSPQNVAPATNSTFNIDVLLDQLAADTDDIYDSARDAGIMAREALDAGRYDIGDLATLLHKRYGDNIIGVFAEDINCRPASVREYRRVCHFWTRPARNQLFDEMPSLAYSMLRDSIRFKDTAKALDFLRLCDEQGWKCERAHIEANKLLGSEVPEMFKVLDTVMSASELDALRLAVEVMPGSKFRLVVYQFSEESKP